MKENSIKRYSLSEQVADKIEKMIEKGEYKINEKIPTEVELIEKFGVSRITIREAIKSLVSIGILEVYQGDGTYVRANNRFDATMNKVFNDANINEIIETRKTLEISITMKACERRTEKDLEKIYNALIKRQTSKDDEKENTIADIEFHMEIANASHNKLLVGLYKSLYSYLYVHILKSKSKADLTNEEIDKLHYDLYEAIKNKDLEKVHLVTKLITNI